MYNIIITDAASASIRKYSERYREYYEELYRDSGIWVEDQIIEGYIHESLSREDEIYATIGDRLSGKYDIVKPLGDTIWIKWRSRHIFITYEDDGDDRIITDIDIR